MHSFKSSMDNFKIWSMKFISFLLGGAGGMRLELSNLCQSTPIIINIEYYCKWNDLFNGKTKNIMNLISMIYILFS